MAAVRLEVTDRFGTVAEVLDLAVLDTLNARKRAMLDRLATDLVDGLAKTLGCGEQHAWEAAVAELMRLTADEAAYERVAARRNEPLRLF